ncbi:MAG: hypothetical protein M1814_001225 [Vezdaea aestivalis]|nr:MAG: hypothetical protein M1814_001225 [Vezdaea aestivalis]
MLLGAAGSMITQHQQSASTSIIADKPSGGSTSLPSDDLLLFLNPTLAPEHTEDKIDTDPKPKGGYQMPKTHINAEKTTPPASWLPPEDHDTAKTTAMVMEVVDALVDGESTPAGLGASRWAVPEAELPQSRHTVQQKPRNRRHP